NPPVLPVGKDHISDEVPRGYGLQSGKSLFNLSVYIDPTIDENTKKPTGTPAERIQNVSLFAGAGERRLDRVLTRLSNLVSSASEFKDKEEDVQGADFPV